MASKASMASDDENDNTYFVSFLLRDRKNKTLHNEDGTLKQRMVVNNNFSGEKMGASQVFVESGQPPKQPAMHNIQLLNNKAPTNPSYQQPYSPQNPRHYG